ncbi:helix-turn-helix domain-containing protein [Streptomyces sp. NBC_00464]|uniref:helix-turn-helix domain-containing protein n=1 Tax=Streptomyces sp. NBC_00464 TaxID=2975751 RepID=UPI003FA6BB6E
MRAGTTQRHLSFIESGRSAPGRSMIIRLGEALEVPIRERNELLLAAGCAPVYPQTPWTTPNSHRFAPPSNESFTATCRTRQWSSTDTVTSSRPTKPSTPSPPVWLRICSYHR